MRLFLALGCAVLCGSPRGFTQDSPPGTLDATFSPTLDNYAVYAVAVQSDGKVLLGGDFSRVNDLARSCLVRLNSGGSVDTAFTALAGANNYVRALAVQADGRIVVGGDFSTIGGAGWRSVARLNPDGSPDPTFGQFAGANERVLALAVQPDGKILIGGRFTKVNGVTRNYLARLNPDGALDTGFNAHADGYVDALALRPDGHILAGGEFASVNNTPRTHLVQLAPDGTVDSAFNVQLDLTVWAIALQPNGQALIGGSFAKVNNFWQGGIARVNADGSRDSTFTASASGSVYALTLQPNGKVVLAGRFSTVNGTTQNNVARLNPNGLLDASFNVGSGPDYTVRCLALQGDGKLILGDEFATVDFVDHTRVARLWGDPPPPAGDDVIAQIWTAVEIG